MERASESPVVWFLKSDLQQAVLGYSCVKSEAHTLGAYSLGNCVPDETLTRLPDLFLRSECKIIKSEKKIRVVRLPLRIGRTIKSVYVKQHNALSFRHQLTSLVCPSAALRSLCGAATLLREGYSTARPVAAVEYRRWGVLITSFYVSEEIAGAKTIADYWREDLLGAKAIGSRLKRRALLRKLARLLKSLHETRIYHDDLKAANILALKKRAATEEIFLIDLQGVRKCFYLSRRRRIKNLAQINRTLGNHVTRTEKLSFIKAYVGDRIFDRRNSRQLILSILKETNRQVIREKVRHRSAENYTHPRSQQATAVNRWSKCCAFHDESLQA
jgi:hypothetical protein